jgi:hypothetical protein
MASKADFTADEWKQLHLGVTGAGMVVSYAHKDISDSFGEATTLAKYLATQATSGPSELVRELASGHTTGFGLFASPAKVFDETMAALTASVATLKAKAPVEVGHYRTLALGAAHAVAEAKGGVQPPEAQAIASIEKALGEG